VATNPDSAIAAAPTSRQRDDLFRLLVENVRDYAIFLLDSSGHIQTWNEGAERINGYIASEIVGHHFSIFYPPADIRHGKPDFELRFAADEGKYEEEGWRVRKNGKRFWASVVITALRNPRGELVGFAKVTRDLSEQKIAEEERIRLLEMERAARAEAEATLEQLTAVQSVTEAALTNTTLESVLRALLDRTVEIFSADTAVVLLMTEDGTALVPMAAKALEEEVDAGIRIPVGHGFAGRVAAENRPIALDDVQHAEVLNPILREKGVRSLLGVPLRVDSTVMGVLHVGTLYIRRFTDSEVRLLQIIADRVAMAISHARLYEEAQRARREAEEAGVALRMRDDFLSVAAHELKTPVTSLRGLSEWLIRTADREQAIDPARQRRSLVMINRQAQSLTRLVTQLLELSRLEAGRLQLDLQVENLTDLVSRLVEQARALTDQHEITLSAPGAVRASIDALRFEQVVTNLLDNAIKYSPDGGRIDVILDQVPSRHVRLIVQDQGIGIPSDQLDEIFERYHQAHADSHRSGLGLGLFISQQIVARHGGRISVESTQGSGSRFVVEIPAWIEPPLDP
jgi:PAS domain S-box-containing protein